MDTKQLQLFLHLSETLHFGKTSEALHLSPSALSRAIMRIEDEVGQPLFERDKRSVCITDAGRQFQQYARQSLAQWREINQQLKRDAELIDGEVSVYCSVTAVYSILAGILEPFRQRFPGIEIKLHTGDQADAIDRVVQGGEDVAIAARPQKLSTRVQFQTLLHSPLLFIYPRMNCAVESKVHEFQRRIDQMPWEHLPFILAERGEARNRLDLWFRSHSVKPNVYARVSGNEAIVSMVALGFGIGLVPEIVLANSPLKDGVNVLDVQPPLAPFAVGICALAQHLDKPQVRAFWDCAKAAYKLEL